VNFELWKGLISSNPLWISWSVFTA